MRLATIATNEGTVAAVIRDHQFTSVNPFSDVGELIAAGDDGFLKAKSAAIRGSWSALSEAALTAPFLAPGAVFCVGHNYRTHILEMGRELPEHPTLFAKLARTLASPGEPVRLPKASGMVDYEGELVIVIGQGGRDIPENVAAQHIAGYTLMNDVSVRDWQYRTQQWFAGKNFERSSPVGPAVTTADEFAIDQAEITVTVNGELRQHARFADLLFPPARLVADISRITTLRPNDLIATGTPGGVGHAMVPPRYLKENDLVEVTVGSIGTLRTRFLST